MSDSKLSTPPMENSEDHAAAVSQQIEAEMVGAHLGALTPRSNSPSAITDKIQGVKAKASDADDVPAPPETPKVKSVGKKTLKTPKTPKTPKSNGKRAAPADGESSAAKKVKNEDGTPSGRKGTKKIATTLDELTTEDRLLISMRDEGKSWSDIADMWARETGAPPGGKSTLPNRYSRLKANLAQVSDEHMELLVNAYKKVHEQFEQEKARFEVEKWSRIKTVMEEAKGVADQKYTVAALQKYYKKAVDAIAAKAASSTDGDAGPSGAIPAAGSEDAGESDRARHDSAVAFKAEDE
ncbi:uncharacterized protein BDZ99DRAFT_564967 [Mytilinidion resinicola]|uniref:Uncharacterized protein n=1 Tax=Mytilinidion resinicola TaxID=574789 RepID=A0A6A6Z859_9PEZI|nr:uncharacterized protein BDZ99DRAFT_564967 [Mytilinidion resinicola]KAF2817190.1 hypothetical protein BDZ99DRAFT_564967 [Mytilinidion resinicola]